MPVIFEYGKWHSLVNTKDLRKMLFDISKQTKFNDAESDTDENENDRLYQPFLQFDGNAIKANNFVGFIQTDGELIEIYPKVFREYFSEPANDDKILMLRHIFYWFSYCRKWKFPFTQASLDTIDIYDFPELIINLIANQFLNTVSEYPLTMYQQKEEALNVPRGSINFARYISNSLAYGKFQNIECDYEPFLFDNKINRIIKYCTRLLMLQTKFSENTRLLQEVIFILDEVEDCHCSIHDINSVSINSFFTDYLLIMDSCKLILNQQLYSSKTNDLTQWCLLFPMEYIFEDFIAGFLEKNFSKDWKVEYQKSNLYLSDKPKVFNMQHDIFLTSRHDSTRKIIIDTKYKLREISFKSDPKRGIAQNDLYQMVSYGYKRGCSEIVLIYPNINENQNDLDTFEIASGFSEEEKIYITALEVPFWSLYDFGQLEAKMFNTFKEYFLSPQGVTLKNHPALLTCLLIPLQKT